jgi:glycosyltransferase involved in cell wall biosynthesis
VPVRNEPQWIRRCIERINEELQASAWWNSEVIVIDDQSTDETPSVLFHLQRVFDVRLIQERTNVGRFRARWHGMQAANGEFVLLIDSRVLLERGSLEWIGRRITPESRVWNGHCIVNTESVYGRFWDALPRIAWSTYLADPRLTSFGPDDFDLYPKGTTCFLGPRQVLLEACESFSTYYGDIHNASDDTAVIRWIAERFDIWLSPEFACTYEPRRSLRRFLPHTLQRGVVFVDGHLRRDSRYAPLLALFYPLSAGVLLAAFRWPWVPVATLLAADVGVVALGAIKGLPRGHVAALAALSPVFAVTYGLGIWKGMGLAVANALKRRREAFWREGSPSEWQ